MCYVIPGKSEKSKNLKSGFAPLRHSRRFSTRKIIIDTGLLYITRHKISVAMKNFSAFKDVKSQINCVQQVLIILISLSTSCSSCSSSCLISVTWVILGF